MTPTEQPWFGDEPGRTDDEAGFLARLRSVAATWQYPDLTPDDSSVIVGFVPLMLEIEIPDLPIRNRYLRVAYWTSGAHPTGLEGVWEDRYFEGPSGRDLDDLIVIGVLASPTQFADWVAAWFARQLARPVIRQEWLRNEEVCVTNWQLPETGRILERKGHFWFRGRGTEPDRTTRIR